MPVRGSRGPGNQVDSKVPIFDRTPILIYYNQEAVLQESPSAAKLLGSRYK